jgi:hypothetical protein
MWILRHLTSFGIHGIVEMQVNTSCYLEEMCVISVSCNWNYKHRTELDCVYVRTSSNMEPCVDQKGATASIACTAKQEHGIAS